MQPELSSSGSNNFQHTTSTSFCSKMSERSIRKNTVWTDTGTNILLDILVELKQEGEIAGKSIEPRTWNTILERTISRTRMTDLTMSSLKEKHARMKSEWRTFKSLVESSGAGWNNVLQTIEVEGAKLEAFKKLKDAEKYLKKPLARYLEMNDVWGGGVATGAFARGSNQPPMTYEEEREKLKQQYKFEGSCKEDEFGKCTKGKSKSSGSPSPYSRKPSSGDIHNLALQCYITSQESKAKRKAMEREEREKSVMSRGPVWSITECINDVQLIPGISDEQIGNAVMLFQDKGIHEGYMALPQKSKYSFIRDNCK